MRKSCFFSVLLLLSLLATAGCGNAPSSSPTSSTTRTLPGGTGTPAASGPGVYLLGVDGSLAAFNASDGTQRWHTHIPGIVGGMQLVGKSLYVVSDMGLYALNADDGSVRWHIQPADSLSESLVADQDTLYITAGNATGSSVYALNASDGSVRWQKPDVGGASSLGEGDVLVCVDLGPSGEGQPFSPSVLTVLNASDGSVRWRSQRSGQIDQPPVVANGAVYLSESLPTLNGSTLYALSEQDGKTLWRSQPSGQYYYATPAVADGLVYTSNPGHIYAFSAQDGSLLWRSQRGDIDNSPPVVADHAVYVSSTDQALPGSSVSALNASDGSQRWRVQVGNPSLALRAALAVSPLSIHSAASMPIVVDGVVYFWSDGMLYALNASNGMTLWKTGMVSPGIHGLAVG